MPGQPKWSGSDLEIDSDGRVIIKNRELADQLRKYLKKGWLLIGMKGDGEKVNIVCECVPNLPRNCPMPPPINGVECPLNDMCGCKPPDHGALG